MIFSNARLILSDGIRDDLELVVLFQRTLDSGENERVVVCDQNSHGQSLIDSPATPTPR